jgi:hypothetical protein
MFSTLVLYNTYCGHFHDKVAGKGRRGLDSFMASTGRSGTGVSAALLPQCGDVLET